MGTVIVERFGERSISLEQEVFSAGKKLYMNQALKISNNNNLTKAAALLGTTCFLSKREDGEGGIKEQ